MNIQPKFTFIVFFFFFLSFFKFENLVESDEVSQISFFLFKILSLTKVFSVASHFSPPDHKLLIVEFMINKHKVSSVQNQKYFIDPKGE